MSTKKRKISQVGQEQECKDVEERAAWARAWKGTLIEPLFVSFLVFFFYFSPSLIQCVIL